MGTKIWYNEIVGVATHRNNSAGSDQGLNKTDPMGAAPFSYKEGARQPHFPDHAERGRIH